MLLAPLRGTIRLSVKRSIAEIQGNINRNHGNIRKIKPGGILLCTLLGVKDEWNKENSIYPFFTREQIIELFKRDYEFDENNTNEFREIESDSFKADKKTMKHWHSFLIKAKKK